MPNEIIYFETGFYELKAEIYRAQYKFWAKIKNDIESDQDTNVAKLFKSALERNVHYLRHYKKLHKDFQNEVECFKHYKEIFTAKAEMTIVTKSNPNSYSIYHDYLELNNDLITPVFYEQYVTSEPQRILLTKYRTGSHPTSIPGPSRSLNPSIGEREAADTLPWDRG